MTNLQAYKDYITAEYNTYVTELKTGNFSRTELNAYQKRDFYYQILKGIKAVEKHNEAKELQYTCRTLKELDKYTRVMNKQEKIAKENLENAWQYLD